MREGSALKALGNQTQTMKTSAPLQQPAEKSKGHWGGSKRSDGVRKLALDELPEETYGTEVRGGSALEVLEQEKIAEEKEYSTGPTVSVSAPLT